MYRLTGEVETENIDVLSNICKEIFGNESVRKKSNQEMRIRSTKVTLEIYQNMEDSFLIGGFIYQESKMMNKTINKLSKLLKSSNLPYYSILYCEEDENSNPISEEIEIIGP